MQRLTILVDMDDTLENLCETWVEFLNETHGTTVHKDDIHDWDMSKAFPTIENQQVYDPLFNENMWKRVTPLPGAVEYLKRLIDDGHKVVIVTASHQNTVAMKLNNVLFRYFPYLTTSDVIITSQKQLVRGDVLVDDAPHNHIGGQYLKILMDSPHNREFDAQRFGMVRVYSWLEVYDTIRQFAERA